MTKKVKIVFLLILALVFAVQGIGMETASAAVAKDIWTADEVTYANLLKGLDDAAATGIVAETFIQNGHSEANVIVDEVYRNTEDPFLISGRAAASMPFEARATLTLPEAHLAEEMVFGLYTKEGPNYKATGITKKVKVAGETEVEIDFGRITDETLRLQELYIFQVENGAIVKENGTNLAGLSPEYGPGVHTGADGIVYIGKLSYAKQPGSNRCTLFQGEGSYDREKFQGAVTELKLGPTVRLYAKDFFGTYWPMNDSKGMNFPANQIYIRDSSWDESWGYQLLADVTHNGYSYQLYGEHDFTVTYEKDATKAKKLLDQLENLSYNLANSELGIGGICLQNPGSTPLETGNSTVTGTITDGKVVSLYTVPVINGKVQATSYMIPGYSQPSQWTSQGLPIAENEYVVINVVVPDGVDTIDFQSSDTAISLYNGNGDLDAHGDWGKGTVSFGRLIWNPVVKVGNEYLPYTGKILAGGESAGILLAPASTEMVNNTADAATLITRKLDQGQGMEVHQTSFDTSGTYVRMTHKPAITMTGTKKWNDRGHENARPEKITVELHAKLYQSGRGPSEKWESILLDTFEVEPDANGNWKWEIKDLPKIYNGRNVGYWVEEVVDFSYYDYELGQKVFKRGNRVVAEREEYDQIQMDITNTYNADSLVVKAEKAWEDNDDQDGIRPDSVKVTLQSKWTGKFGSSSDGWHDHSDNWETIPFIGGKYNDTVTLSDANGWMYTFKDLVKTTSWMGDTYTWEYRLLEEKVEGYTAEITGGIDEGYTITNTHKPETVSFSGIKRWQTDGGNEPQDYVNVYLKYADGSSVLDAEGNPLKTQATKDNNWKWSFPEQPKYNDGVEIKYVVTEEPVNGYFGETVKKADGTYELVNTIKKVKLQGEKKWESASDNTWREMTVYIDVFRKSDDAKMATVETKEHMYLNGHTPWRWEVELPAIDPNGDPAEYYIKEQKVPNYSTDIKENSTTVDSATGKTTIDYTVTNTFTQIDVKVNKIWNDEENKDDLRPAKLKLTLWQKPEGGEWEKAYIGNKWDNKFIEATLDVANGESSYTFENLLEYIKVDNKWYKLEFKVEEEFLKADGSADANQNEYTSTQTAVTDDKGNTTITLVNSRGDQELKTVVGTLELSKKLAVLDWDQPSSEEVTVRVTPRADNPATCSLTKAQDVTIQLSQTAGDRNFEWVGQTDLDITFMAEGKYSFDVQEVYDDKTVEELASDKKLPDGMKLDTTKYTFVFDVQKDTAGELEIAGIQKLQNGVNAGSEASANFYNEEQKENLGLTKKWVGDTEAVRPAEIKLNLFYRDVESDAAWTPYTGTVKMTTEKTSTDEWEITVEELPRFINNKLVEWSVTEVAPADYKVSYTDSEGTASDRADEGGAVITNTYQSTHVQFSATKVLQNGTLQAGQFTFLLKDEAGNLLQSKTNAADGSVTFDPISYTQDDLGSATTKQINYTIQESIPQGAVDNGDGTFVLDSIVYDGKEHIVTAVLSYDLQQDVLTVLPGYNTEDGSAPTFTNTYDGSGGVPALCYAKVVKVWDDNNNAAGKRPESVSVKLLVNGVPQETAVVLNAANNWTHEWLDLVATDAAGNMIQYDVAEDPVAGYTSKVTLDTENPGTYIITNTKTTEEEKTYSVELEKADKLDPSKKLLGAVYTLYTNQACLPEHKYADVTTGQDGTAKLENVPAGTYWVKETIAPDGYQIDPEAYPITVPNPENPDEPVKVQVKDYPETSVAVKKVWEGVAEGTELPEITVQLMADGKAVEGKTLKLNAACNWAGEFTELDSYDELTDKAIVYTVEEIAVKGYAATVTGDAKEGFTITNTKATEEEKISITVTKVWEDNNNAAGVRPDYIQVVLSMGGGRPPVDGIKVLNAENNWTYTWNDVPVYDGSGNLLKYTVIEKIPADAAKHYVGTTTATENGFILTNTYVTEEKLGQLSLSKTVVADSKTNDSFLFDIELSRTDSNPVAGSYEATLNGIATEKVTFVAEGKTAKATVSLKDGETLVIRGLRAGTTYLVSEQPNKLYDVQINGVAATSAKGTISDTKLSVAKFQNTLKLVGFTVKKEWTGLAEGETAPAIKLTLYCNGKAYPAVTPAPDKNGWYTYTNLPAYVDGKLAVYTVKEEPVTGFTTTYLNKGENAAVTDCAHNGSTIVNSKIPQTGDTAPLTLWMLTALLAVFGLAAVTAKLRKREN